MQMDFNVQGKTGVATLRGGLNAVHVDRFRTEFKSWYDANPEVKNMVLDFSEVDMVDSAGLGALIAVLKHVQAREGDLRLAGLSRRVRMVFEITRTHRIFDIVDTVDEALATVE